MASVKENVQSLFAEIKKVCGRCGRDPAEISVLAAAKYATAEQLNEAVAAGISLIGENRIQDAKRREGMRLPVAKHFIGHLQTNKAKEAVKLFDCIESVDSYHLAEMINVEAERSLKRMEVLVEVNIAGEEQKFGIKPEEIHHFLHKLDPLKFLNVKGLMTVAPFNDDPEKARPYLREMRTLFGELKKVRPVISVLSMGMTNDFRVAIEEGSTEIRIGAYLFK